MVDMLSVYADESSDERKERVFAVAGLIGNDELWESLEVKWNARTSGIMLMIVLATGAITKPMIMP